MTKREEQLKAYLKKHPEMVEDEAHTCFAMEYGIELEDGQIADYNDETGAWEHKTKHGVEIVRM